MKPAVLITGGSGLLAVNWAQVVRDRVQVTLGLHRRKVSMRGVATVPLALDAPDDLARQLRRIRPKIVIHTAGLTSVEECEADPGLARHVNVDLAGNVAQACMAAEISLIHISTDHLFAGDNAGVRESEPPAPKNVYGRTKADAEIRVLELHERALVVRTNFYGWGPSYRPSFSDRVINSLRNGETVTLFQDVYFTPILAETLALAAHDLLERGARGIFHVTGDERISKHEFGLRVSKQFGLDSSLIKAGSLADRPDTVSRPYEMSMSNDKASGLLGRKLGGVDAHLARLRRQEELGLAREIACI